MSSETTSSTPNGHGASVAGDGSVGNAVGAGQHRRRPQGNGAGQGRVCVAFTLYRLRASVFVVPFEERRRLAAEFEAAVDQASEHLGVLRSYSLVGLRADADILLWQAAETADGLQRFAAALRTTALWPHLEIAYQYLAMTRRSIYVDQHVHEGQEGRRTTVKPAGAPYLFIYPFVKTRAWYALPMAERQRMMDQHIAVGHKYPSIRINTTYSFGLDDQEFVVAFEGDNPSEFLDLVMELRSSEASAYTLRDTPAFTAVSQSLDTALALALGIGRAASSSGTARHEPVAATTAAR